MVSERNRISNLIDYIKSCGVEVNIGKNKARGNKGFFQAKGNVYRIDITKGLAEDSIIGALAHEFAHYVHFMYDNSLQNLDFIFPCVDDVLDELLSITVALVPKIQAEKLFKEQEILNDDIRYYYLKIKDFYPDFRINSDNILLEQKIRKTPLKYLLKYDNVEVVELLGVKKYSVSELGDNSPEELYLKLKSKRRKLKKIKAKISRLNKYYNSTTELFARSFELYITNREKLNNLAPKVKKLFDIVIDNGEIPLLSEFVDKIATL